MTNRELEAIDNGCWRVNSQHGVQTGTASVRRPARGRMSEAMAV